MSTDYGKKKKPARERLLDLLRDKEWHPWQEMEEAGGMRYSARLLELKRLGYVIESRGRPEDGKEYRFVGKGEPKPKMVKIFITEEQAEYLATRTTVRADVRAAVTKALNSFLRNKDRL